MTRLDHFTNTATATGNGPGGTPTTDDGSVPVTFEENPSIGVAKSVDTPVNHNDGTYSLNYTILVENTGDVVLNGVQVTDDLSTTFAGVTFVVNNVSSSDFSVNFPGYDGNTNTNLLDGSDNLVVGESGIITLSLTVTPGTNLGPYLNTAVGSGTSVGGTPVTDDSQDGTIVDPDNDGDPTNNNLPTPLNFDEAPQIGVAKDIIEPVTDNNDGSYSFFYEIRVEKYR